jgi:alginate O-acetyltransferase complex protein AlgI
VLFNSTSFLLFFPLVTAGFFALPHRWRWAFLLAASCYFYMSFIPIYILILAYTIAVDYIAGLWIENAAQPRRRWYLGASLFANIGALFVFKYFNFFISNFDVAARWLGVALSVRQLGIILPLGLSFHTFQAMSYTLDVYYGRAKAERHLGVYALYVMYYPQLVAGPIERPNNLLPLLHAEHHWDWNRAARGLQLMLWGAFQKVVIADRLSTFVHGVYDHPGVCRGLPVLLATYAFAFQIYCDFAGYTDIAIGASEVMGIRLMRNFNQPYFAESIPEFWNRWHISLSTWFRDYVYYPLARNTKSWGGFCIPTAIIVTFLLSGLWHGANWTYVAWGALHAMFMLADYWTRPLRRKLSWEGPIARAFNVAVTFHLVCLSWVFFRARSVGEAWVLLRSMFEGSGAPVFSGWPSIFTFGLSDWDLGTAVAAVLMLLILQSLQRSGSVRSRLAAQPQWVRWSVYYAAIGLIIFFGKFERQPFIYFQF